MTGTLPPFLREGDPDGVWFDDVRLDTRTLSISEYFPCSSILVLRDGDVVKHASGTAYDGLVVHLRLRGLHAQQICPESDFLWRTEGDQLYLGARVHCSFTGRGSYRRDLVRGKRVPLPTGCARLPGLACLSLNLGQDWSQAVMPEEEAALLLAWIEA